MQYDFQCFIVKNKACTYSKISVIDVMNSNCESNICLIITNKISVTFVFIVNLCIKSKHKKFKT